MKKVSKEGLVLGSGSPRRKEILSLADITFDVKVSDVDESFDQNTPVNEVAQMLSLRKAKAIQEQFDLKGTPILTADTVVTIDEDILGKPANREEAISMLSRLSGRQHKVLTGVTYLYQEDVISFTDETLVTFSPMSEEDIEYYVDKYQPFDKAGAYAIQEWIGVRFIEKIEGCYYNVMGLPMPKIKKLLGW